MTDVFVKTHVTFNYIVTKTHNGFDLYFKTGYILAVNFDLTRFGKTNKYDNFA